MEEFKYLKFKIDIKSRTIEVWFDIDYFRLYDKPILRQLTKEFLKLYFHVNPTKPSEKLAYVLYEANQESPRLGRKIDNLKYKVGRLC